MQERPELKALQIAYPTGKAPSKKADSAKRTTANQHTLPYTSTISLFRSKIGFKISLDRKKLPSYDPTHQKQSLINNDQSEGEQIP
jgi:hypothetical protein